MRQQADLSFKSKKILMMRVFRQICVFGVISLFLSLSFAAEKDIQIQFDVKKAYKNKDFKKIVVHFKNFKKPLSLKERTFQVLSYGHLGDVDGKIEVLRQAVKQYPKSDLFKRELASSLEFRADSYADTSNYRQIKNRNQHEAVGILVDLYDKSPTPQNFTALIQYYNRRKLYEEAVGLLEVYARSNAKGKIYYTYLCEAHFKAHFYDSALASCKKLISIRPEYAKGHILHSKVIEKLGEKKIADKNFVKLAQRFPASSPVQFEAGRVLIEKGESELGLQHLERHIAYSPTDEALVLKAETQFEKGFREEALKTYVQACKQHKEPRKPLLNKIKTAMKKIEKTNPLREKFQVELGRCRYAYRPNRATPKGFIGGRFKASNKQ